MDNPVNSHPQNINGQTNLTPSAILAVPASGLLPSSHSGNHNTSASGSNFSTENTASKQVDNLVLSRHRLQELVREVDPNEQLDEDVEEMLLQIADDFIESTVSAACMIAKHRKGNVLDVRDVQLHLERQWNMWIPGFGTEDVRPYKRAPVTEAHKQRMALIRKTLKKY